MRRNLLTLTLAGLFGTLLLAGDASACHKHKKTAACPAPVVACAPAPVVACAPAPVACAPAKKACHMKMPKMTMHHKKAAACPTTYASAPVYSYAPTMASPQASGQSM